MSQLCTEFAAMRVQMQTVSKMMKIGGEGEQRLQLLACCCSEHGACAQPLLQPLLLLPFSASPAPSC